MCRLTFLCHIGSGVIKHFVLTVHVCLLPHLPLMDVQQFSYHILLLHMHEVGMCPCCASDHSVTPRMQQLFGRCLQTAACPCCPLSTSPITSNSLLGIAKKTEAESASSRKCTACCIKMSIAEGCIQSQSQSVRDHLACPATSILPAKSA